MVLRRPMIAQQDKYEVLKRYWGYDNLRGNQEQIIDSVLAGTDTLALMATGGGKSLCYQLPAMMQEGICIVISPLIALMEDQERGLRDRGISAECIHSGKTKRRQDEILDNCIFGKVKFLFLSPEKLRSKLAIARIKQMNIAFFAIDEAHCISQWGHDFRPSYLKLDLIREEFPGNFILALTATATRSVVKDITTYLVFAADHKVFQSSFFRSNISISVSNSSKKIERIKQIVKKVTGSKIIYARNKRHCSEINKEITKLGLKSEVYHSDIPMLLRKERQEAWISNKLECMVCTSAFGMGIDKPDVRLVIHYDLPPSLEEYIQEIGRAGRDNKLSYGVLFYNNYDLQELEFHYSESIPVISRIRDIYNELGKFLRVPIGDGMGSSYALEVEHFIRHVGSNKIELKAAIQTLEKNEYLEVSSSLFISDKFHITAGKDTLNGFLNQTTDIAKLIQFLLRNYEGLLYSYVSVSINSILKRYNWTNEHLLLVIEQAEKQLILKYIHDDGSEKISYIAERLPKGNLSIDHRALRDFYKAKKTRYEAVVDYVLNEDCRPKQLLEYFGENKHENCGICDFCKGVFQNTFTDREFNEARHLVLSALSMQSHSIDELLGVWPWNKQARMKSILQVLVDEGTIIHKDGFFTIAKLK